MASTNKAAKARPPRFLRFPPFRVHEERLSIPFVYRVPLGVTMASVAGFAIGSTHGSKVASLRYRAENAHRLPTTQAGWYMFQRSKMNVGVVAGMKEGFRMGGRTAGWTVLFIVLEEAMDKGRVELTSFIKGEEAADKVSKDFLSTALAGVGIAAAFSAVNRFPVPTAVRLARMGLKAGVLYGLAQDAVSLMRGRRLGYVEFIKQQSPFGSRAEDSQSTPGMVG